MRVHFREDFTSLMRAGLLARCRGLETWPHSVDEGLFSEEYLDADEYSSQVVYQEYRSHFGPLPWMRVGEEFDRLRTYFDYGFRHHNSDGGFLAAQVLEQVLDHGPNWALSRASAEAEQYYLLSRAVGHEFHRFTGFVRLVPLEGSSPPCLGGYCPAEHRILDLLAGHFADRFPGYMILLRSADRECWMYQGVLELRQAPTITPTGTQKVDFDPSWSTYYRSQYIPERRNPRLARKVVPKKYRSWLREGEWLDQAERGEFN